MLKQIFIVPCPPVITGSLRGVLPWVRGDWGRRTAIHPSSCLAFPLRLTCPSWLPIKETHWCPCCHHCPSWDASVLAQWSCLHGPQGCQLLGSQSSHGWPSNPGAMHCALGPAATLCVAQSPTKSLMKSVLSPSGLG